MDNSNLPSQKPKQKIGVSYDPLPLGVQALVSNKKPKKKWLPIALIILVFLLLAGGAYAYFFTNIRYRIPWLRPNHEELINMMYQNFADLKGMDFSVYYEISVGDRDPDAKVPDSKRSRYEEKRVGYQVSSALSSVYYGVNFCQSDNKDLQYTAGNNCNGLEKPVAGQVICEGSNTKWPDLSKYEGWEYDVCNSNIASSTFSILAKTNFNDDKVTCSQGNYCLFEAADDNLGVESNDALDFLSGDWWDEAFYEMEESIPKNFKANLTITGKGLADVEEDKLPNFELGVDGAGKFGSMSMLLNAEARVVDEYIYYKVNEFPFLDITKGHMGEWIQTDESEDMWGEFVPEAQEANKKLEENFSDFIADTAKYDVLEFVATGEEMDVEGIPAILFDVNVKAENVPAWLETVNKIARESGEEEDSALLQMTKESFSEEEKTKLVEKINKVLENLKFSAALNPLDGHLMYIGAKARLLPPADSKQFGNKQFNFIIEMRMWNQNNPSKIEAPEQYVSQDEIEREELDLSVEEYGDYKQSQRVENIREKLNKYHIENKKFPSELSEVTRLNDYNTGKAYKYEVKDGNYYLTYAMNTTPENNNSIDDDWGVYSFDKVSMNMGWDSILGSYYLWHQGDNVADRYTPVFDRYQKSNEHAEGDASDYDVIEAINQSNLIYNTRERLFDYYRKYSKYPNSIEELAKEYKPSYYSYGYLPTGYLCEDLSKNSWCDYNALENNQAFELKVTFGIDSSMLSSDVQSENRLPHFTKGENSFFGEDGKEEFVQELNILLDQGTYRWIKGDPTAPITIVTYSDFDCPFCANFHNTSNQILTDYFGKVNIAYKHFPLTALHPNAEKKALAAECVGNLGGNEKFWKFVDVLFEEKPSADDLALEASGLNINPNQFESCLLNKTYLYNVNSDSQDGVAKGVRGTPHSIIIYNNEEWANIPGALPYESIKSQLDTLITQEGL